MGDNAGMTGTGASEDYARLVEARIAAGRRVDELQRDARGAGEELQASRAALVAFERAGDGTASERAALEKRLRQSGDP